MSRNVANYNVFTQEKELINRKNAQLLNKVLLEQIKAKQRETFKDKISANPAPGFARPEKTFKA